jgi:hypothetical protein
MIDLDKLTEGETVRYGGAEYKIPRVRPFEGKRVKEIFDLMEKDTVGGFDGLAQFLIERFEAADTGKVFDREKFLNGVDIIALATMMRSLMSVKDVLKGEEHAGRQGS